MHFLIDADLPRSLAEVIRSHGHETTDVCNCSIYHQLVEQFLADEGLLQQLPGQLAIVEPGRVRLRRSRP